MIDIEQFFPQLSHFAHRTIFEEDRWVFEPLHRLADILMKLIEQEGAEKVDSLEGTTVVRDTDPAGKRGGKGLFVDRWIETAEAVHIASLDILIGKGVFLEPSAIIKGPALIGPGCEIRQGAYLRGNVLAGTGCILGHATEIKNSILMDHTECGHFNYIGDSVLGVPRQHGRGIETGEFSIQNS